MEYLSDKNRDYFHSNESIREVVIITGLSGAGKTGVVRVLEDLGYYCVDNLPIPMILTFLDFALKHHATSKIALGIDVRGKKFLEILLKEIDALKKKGWQSTIIFLDASDATLIKRYQETRRRHPLEGSIGLPEAILLERSLLEPIMQVADVRVNTDQFNLHELRNWALKFFTKSIDYSLIVNFISFGFKHGIPVESSLLFDVRSLPNPHFIPNLQPKTGCNLEIQSFLFQDTSVEEYWNYLITFLEFSLKKSKEEGRFAVTVSIGCTGGKHRSVAFVERLALYSFKGINKIIYHRDIKK